MRENQRLVCRVLSTTVSASTNQTIQMFSDVSYETGDQHKGTISMGEIRSFRITHYLTLPIAHNSMLRKQERSE